MLENRQFTLPGGLSCTYGYACYLPDNWTKDAHLPLVVFLHGAGERGTDIDLVKFHGPLKLAAQGKKLDYICVAPQCPEDSFWTFEVQTLTEFIDSVAQELGADPDRIYLTGLSMGGFGVWALAIAHPGKYAGIVPICGAGMPWAGYALKNMPIWAFHGEVDSVVNVQGSIEMVNAVNNAGGSAKLTVYPGVDHDSWTRTYNNPEVFDWLLSQKRK